jgi:hypothetical protein
MNKIKIALILTIICTLMVDIGVLAQNEYLTLKLSRDWGYGGLNGDIEGLFSMRVSGSEDLAKVVFYIDRAKIGELTQPPFNFQFNTENYPLGHHQIVAIGFFTSGQEIGSNTIDANFVPKQSMLKFILPVVVVIFAAILLSTLAPLIASRGKLASLPLGAERHYGIRGGAICPKCQRPFILPLFSINLGFTRAAICPYCGKMSLVRTESINKLRLAERAELEEVDIMEPISGQTNEEKLRRELEDSKYKE